MTQQYGFRTSNNLSEVQTSSECLANLGVNTADLLPFANSTASGVEARDYQAIVGLGSNLEQQVVTLTGFASAQLAAISTKTSKLGSTFTGSILANTINNDRPYVTPSGLIIGPSTASYFSPSSGSTFVAGAQYKLGPVTAGTVTSSGLNYTGSVTAWSQYFTRYKNFVTIQEQPSWTARRIPLFLPPPVALSGCTIWLDAEFSEFDLGPFDTVIKWKGVNRGPIAAQPAVLSRPTLVTNVLNGKPAVGFNGGVVHLTLGSLGYLTPTGATVVVVARVFDSDYNIFGTLNNTTIRWNNGSGAGSLGMFTTGVQSGFPVQAQSNGTFVFGVRISQSFGLEFRTNGSSTDYKATGFTYTGGDTWNLGRSGSSLGSFRGDIHSFAVFNRVLSDKEIRTVEEYLAWRYDAIYDPDRTQTLQLENFATIDLEDDTPMVLG